MAVPEVDDVDDEELIVDEDIEPIVLTTPDDDPEIEGDLDTEIPPLDPEDDFVIAPKKGTKGSAEEARAAAADLLEDWGPGHRFKTYDFKTGLAEAGVERKKTWFYEQLSKLEKAGRIRHEDETGEWVVLEARELAGV
ncbi:hypothetical protein [Nocardiopsis sp. TNDT3]|uniref:hypothetical protein n=1 Tax=Nocardiopsis sp. TNDT3 TaxID=2249354 RepID=UPI0013007E5A|nr:hypothetical protein [Nocardiopsis sp. TNDT3]